MLTWLCCFTNLRPEVEAAIRDHAWPDDVAVFFDVSADETDYATMLRTWWNYGNGDLAIVEHDNVIRADVAQAFHECPEGFCAYSYDWTTNRGPALGCTRFRAAFMAEHADAMEWAASQPSAWGKPGHWKQVGWYLTDSYLKQRGIKPHVHLPSVTHLNEAQRLMPEVAHLSDEEHLRRLGLEPAA